MSSKALKPPMTIFMAASQHAFNFSLSELLLIKKIASQKGYLTCSQLGGCESIRDLREANALRFDALECSYVESSFAYQKLLQAISTCWVRSHILETSTPTSMPSTIFLNCHSFDSIKTMSSIIEMHNNSTYHTSIIPVIDRRSLIKNSFSLNTENFDVVDYEEYITSRLAQANLFYGAPFCVSGGITPNSVSKLILDGIFPKYIKTGLFIFEMSESESDLFSKTIEALQMTESIVLEVLKAISHDQYTYSSNRQHRLLLELMNIDEEVA
jgi:hypothetical protein